LSNATEDEQSELSIQEQLDNYEKFDWENWDSKNKNQRVLKKVTRHDPALFEAAASCIQRRLCYKDAIKELQSKCFDVSEKQFQRIKADLKEFEYKKIYDTYSLDPIIIDTQNSINLVVESLWNVVNTSKDNWQKIKASGMILNCLILQIRLRYQPAHI